MTSFAQAAAEPGIAPARLRALLAEELTRSGRELARKRSGYEEPVTVAMGPAGTRALAAALPVPLSARADASALSERAWLVVAAAVEALAESGARGDLRAGELDGHLALMAQ